VWEGGRAREGDPGQARSGGEKKGGVESIRDQVLILERREGEGERKKNAKNPAGLLSGDGAFLLLLFGVIMVVPRCRLEFSPLGSPSPEWSRVVAGSGKRW
jgi:hypothetical protein